MINIFRVLLVFISAVLICSCDSFGYTEEEIKPEYGHGASTLILAFEKFTVHKNGGENLISFTSSGSWVATTDATWISLAKYMGQAGTQSLGFTCSKNNSYEERTACITIATGNISKTITIVQNPSDDAIILEKSSLTVSHDGGMVQVGIKAIVGYTVEVTEGADWISPAVSTDSNVLAFEIAPNTANSARDGEISIINKENSNTIKLPVHQD